MRTLETLESHFEVTSPVTNAEPAAACVSAGCPQNFAHRDVFTTLLREGQDPPGGKSPQSRGRFPAHGLRCRDQTVAFHPYMRKRQRFCDTHRCVAFGTRSPHYRSRCASQSVIIATTSACIITGGGSFA